MARPPTASVPGDRAVALINSSNNVVWTGDLVLGAEAAPDDVLLLARALERVAPRCVRRSRPRNRPPAPPADLIDRESVIAELAAEIKRSRPVNVVGSEGVGKSYVLRGTIGAQPGDGVVWIDGEARDADDVLQAVFHELYDADRIVADRERRRAAFSDLGATVVIDGGDKAAAAAARLRDELEGSALVLASRADCEWGADAASVGLRGLDETNALELIAKRAGPLEKAERQAAGRLIRLLAGNPRRLMQAAGLVVRNSLPLTTLVESLEDDPEGRLRRLLLASLEPTDRALVETLAGTCGATLASEQIRALSGMTDADQRLKRLERDGFLQSASPRYRLAGALADLKAPGRPEQTAEHLSAFARASAPERAAAELPAALALLAWSQDEGRGDLAIVLGRAFAPAAVYTWRWSAWEELLERVHTAAAHAGDRASEAWALHHLGTRAYACGTPDAAISALRSALALREELGDEHGADATRHNLEFITGPPGPPADPGGSPPRPPRPPRRAIFIAGAVALLLAIAGVAALAGGGSQDDPSSTRSDLDGDESTTADRFEETDGERATGPPSIKIGSPKDGDVYPEGTRVVARFTCDGAKAGGCRGDVDGAPVGSGERLPASPGRHLLRVTAESEGGERSAQKASYTVTADGRPDASPTVTITTPTDRATYPASDVPRAAFSCSLGGEPLSCTASVTSPKQLPVSIRSGDHLPAAPGTHTLAVIADDGQQEPVEERRTYTVEQAAVSLEIVFNPPMSGERVVTSSGATCSKLCTLMVDPGVPVTLEAERIDPENGWVPMTVNWTNCQPSSGSTCSLTPGRENMTVTVGSAG